MLPYDTHTGENITITLSSTEYSQVMAELIYGGSTVPSTNQATLPRGTSKQEGAAAVERHTEAILDGPPAAAIREAHRPWTGMLDTADYSGGQGVRKLIAPFHFPHICDQRMADVPRIHEIPARILLTQINSK